MVLGGGERDHINGYVVGDSLMGYRSEVCGVIAVDDRDPEKFKELIGKVKMVGEDLLNQLGEGEVGWKDGVFMFHVDSWKWFDGYSAVIAWNAIWDMASAMEGVSGLFIRIGEELEDNVEDYMGEEWDNLRDYAYISRRIEVDRWILGTKTTEEVQA
jgi:hypothetical protein